MLSLTFFSFSFFIVRLFHIYLFIYLFVYMNSIVSLFDVINSIFVIILCFPSSLFSINSIIISIIFFSMYIFSYHDFLIQFYLFFIYVHFVFPFSFPQIFITHYTQTHTHTHTHTHSPWYFPHCQSKSFQPSHIIFTVLLPPQTGAISEPHLNSASYLLPWFPFRDPSSFFPLLFPRNFPFWWSGVAIPIFLCCFLIVLIFGNCSDFFVLFYRVFVFLYLFSRYCF